MIRVAITGIGVISAIGKSSSEFWDSLRVGRSGIGPIQAVDCSTLRFKNGAEVPDYKSTDYFDEKEAQVYDRFSEFAVIAAREAIRDSALELTPELKAGGSAITGACTGGQISEDQQFEALYRYNRNRCHPLTIPRIMGSPVRALRYQRHAPQLHMRSAWRIGLCVLAALASPSPAAARLRSAWAF